MRIEVPHDTGDLTRLKLRKGENSAAHAVLDPLA
jgi:hypothetical protein